VVDFVVGRVLDLLNVDHIWMCDGARNSIRLIRRCHKKENASPWWRSVVGLLIVAAV